MFGLFQLQKPTLGVFLDTHIAIAIPEGAIIEIQVAPGEGHKTVDVLWEGQGIMMFVRDLKERAEQVRDSPRLSNITANT